MDMFQASFARYLQENGLGTTRQRLHIAAIFFALGGRQPGPGKEGHCIRR